MRRFTIFLVTALIATGTAGCGFFFGTRPVFGDRFAGEFDMIGEASYKDTYNVHVTSARKGAGYHMYWEQDGELTFFAKGIESGDLIAAVYASDGMMQADQYSATIGIVAYLEKGGLLTGLWANWNEPWLIWEKQPGASTLEPEFIDVAGLYRLEGTTPDGESYTGEMSLMLTGDTWQGWGQRGSGMFKAFGLVMDGKLVLASTNLEGLSIGIYEIAGDGLTGTWVYSAYEDMGKGRRLKAGSERAVKR